MADAKKTEEPAAAEPTVEVAEYRTLSPTFIEPHLIPAGRVVKVPAGYEPGYHLEPLNDAARAAMDKWEEKVRQNGGTAVGARVDATLPQGSIARAMNVQRRLLSVDEEFGPKGDVDLTQSLAEALTDPQKAKPGLTG